VLEQPTHAIEYPRATDENSHQQEEVEEGKVRFFERCLAVVGSGSLAQSREEHGVPDRLPPRKHHRQPVDAEPQATGRRHTV
jgi:hypothetical protein